MEIRQLAILLLGGRQGDQTLAILLWVDRKIRHGLYSKWEMGRSDMSDTLRFLQTWAILFRVPTKIKILNFLCNNSFTLIFQLYCGFQVVESA